MVGTKKNLLILGMTNNPGGVETYIKTLVDTANEKYNILIAKSPGTHMLYSSDKFRYVDCPFIDSAVIKVIGKHKITKWLLEQNISILYVNALSANLAVWVAAGNVLSIPVFYHSHNEKEVHKGILRSAFSNVMSGYNRKILDHANRVACSIPAGKFMFDGAEFKVILNGVNPKLWKFSVYKRELIREKFKISEDKKVVCVVARMQKQKNYVKIVSVIKELIKEKPQFCALIVGDGEEREAISSALKGLVDEKKVFLLGSIDYVDEIMSASDALLLPSLFEGLPYTLVEAQASGLPIISSIEAFPAEAEVLGTVFSKISLSDDDGFWVSEIERLANVTNNERLAANKLFSDSKFNVDNTKTQIRGLLRIE